jgi:hypothetical protein
MDHSVFRHGSIKSPSIPKIMKNKTHHTWLLAIAVTAVSAISAQAAVNLFANGGFETPGAGPPAAFGWLPAASGYTLSSDARTGSFSASLASPAFNAAVMLQNSVTNGGLPGLTPGDTPTLSFYAKGFAGGTGNVLYALRYLDAGGNILANSGNVFFQGLINPTTWTQINGGIGAVPAGATSAFIEFSQGIGPIDGVNLAGTILIDDVVLLGEAIPEPSSIALLGLGSVALLARRRRQA